MDGDAYWFRNLLLLHFDGSRGLLRVIVRNSANAVHFVNDARRGLGEELVAEGVRNGSHEIGRAHGAQDDNVAVHTLVAHDTDGLRQVQSGIGLGDLVVETSLADHRDEDVVGLTGHADLLLGHFAKHANGEAGTGEGVSANKLRRDTELSAQFSDLVLEQLAQRLNQLETLALCHPLGQTTDVVVRFDAGTNQQLSLNQTNAVTLTSH